jgi:hypothetical protein
MACIATVVVYLKFYAGFKSLTPLKHWNTDVFFLLLLVGWVKGGI